VKPPRNNGSVENDRAPLPIQLTETSWACGTLWMTLFLLLFRCCYFVWRVPLSFSPFLALVLPVLRVKRCAFA
jgi:hypothetical protein